MAEIREIQVKITSDTEGFVDIQKAADETSESIESSTKRAISSHELLLEKLKENQNEGDFPVLTPEQQEAVDKRGKELLQSVKFVIEEVFLLIQTLTEEINLAIQNSNLIGPTLNMSLAFIAAGLASLSAGLLGLPLSVVIGSFAVLSLLILGATGNLDGFTNATVNGFKSLLDLIKPTDEQLQNTVDNMVKGAKDIDSAFEGIEFGIVPDSAFDNIRSLRDVFPELSELEQGFFIDFNFGGPPPSDVSDQIENLFKDEKKLNDEVQRGNELREEQSSNFSILEGAVAMANGGLVAGAGAQSGYAVEARNTTEQVGKLGVGLQGAGGAADDFTDSLQQVENSGSFFQGIKDGFKEFADSVGSNSELAANFFADTLSQMSQNFSDLFFNVIKGNFDDLADLAKQAFDAILKSFLDLVSAIATKQIVISIGGLFGLGGGKSGGGANIVNSAGDILGKGSSAISGIGGLFGGGGSVITGAGTGFSVAAGGITPAATAISAAAPGVSPLIAASALESGAIGIEAGGGLLAGLGGAIPVIGAVLAAAAIAVPFIIGALKKTPRLDLDFDTFRDEFGKSTGEAAKVMDFLDKDLFNNDIFNRSVSRQAGLGLGDQLPDVIREAIEGQITAIQQIIFQLPADLAAQLNESLLNTDIDITSKVKGDRLLEFDETKNIAEKFKQFIEGDLQARFIFAIRDFFVGAFDSLGAIPEAAQSFVDEQFEEFQNLKGREARAKFGQEFLQDFQTFVDAFNVLEGKGVDSIGATINQLKSLSSTLGFDAIPSIGELDAKLEELVGAAELDPDMIQDVLDLRAALLQLQSSILSSISSIISNISSLNATIVSIGGSAVDLTGFIDKGLEASLGILGQDGLSLDDRESALDQALGFANQLLAEEQAIFQRQQEAAQRAAEARAEQQRAAVRAQIDGLEREKELITKNFDARLEALQEELQIAEEFARLNESILKTLESIVFSTESVFTAVEQVGLTQSEIAGLQGELQNTSDPTRQAEIAGQLEQAFERLFSLAGDAFGVNSPEFVAIFDQVTGGLGDLADLTAEGSRSVEEINAEIESLNLQRNEILEGIDARIDAAQERLSAIQTQNVEATFQASDRVREVFELIRDEYIALYEERMAQLEEVTEVGFDNELGALNALVAVEDESLTVLRSIEGILSGAKSFARGSGGIVDFGRGTLAFLHGREAVVTESQITPINEFGGAGGDMNVNVNVNVNGGSEGAVMTVSNEIENMLVRSIRQGGRLRSAIQEAGARRIN